MDWYKHFATKFLAATAHMSLAHRGAYITLLNHQWDRGGYLPGDLASASRLAGVASDEERAIVAEVLDEKFEHSKRGYYNKRMLRLCKEAKHVRDRRRDAGRKGGLAKARANAIANASEEPGKRARARRASTSPSISFSEEKGGSGGKEDAEDLVRDWNFWAAANDRPKARLTKSLRRKIATRVAEGFDWPAVLAELKRVDDFALGRTDRWNGITLHWLLENDTNWTKVAEGNYRGKREQKQDRERAMKQGEDSGWT